MGEKEGQRAIQMSVVDTNLASKSITSTFVQEDRAAFEVKPEHTFTLIKGFKLSVKRHELLERQVGERVAFRRQ